MSNPLLIKHNLDPTPINFWKINVLNHKHSLQIANENEVISRLYPPAEVYMTKHGVEYNNLHYSCDRVVEGSLDAIARTNGRWKMDARINENTTNYIYVQFGKNEGFTKCNLLPRSNMFENQPMYESDVFQDWRDQNKSESPINIESADSGKMRRDVEKVAKARTSAKKTSFSKRTKDVRANRKQEIIQSSNAIDNKSSENPPVDNSAPTKNKVVHLPRRPKGTK
jgi:hypothetical protein